MFIHIVLFEIGKSQQRYYRKDCKLWASYAKKAAGFIGYHTLKRLGHKNQFASSYFWKTKRDHDRFMKEWHEPLVAKSKAKVRVLGYYNYQAIQSE